jgi:D-serine deaminase-like pyridoxal phosphate-dependent protein
MKTHKTIEGGILMTDGTSRGIVVSTLAEAEFYADAGFDDILYGYPLTPEKIPRCLALANRLEQFHVFTDNEVIIDALAQNHNPKGWSVFLKVDCGNGRAGIHHKMSAHGATLVKKITAHENMRFAGFYVHCGDSYRAGVEGESRVTDIVKRTIERLHEFAKKVEGLTGISCPRLGIGSTPSCSHPIKEMKSITELHPGNYAFYDAQQYTLGSCSLDDIACTVATRVIGHYPHRNEMLIDCGFSALTKQGMGQMSTGCVIFKDEPDLKLLDMTQEIGKVTTVDEDPLDWGAYPIGSMLFMYPWHSCATAALHPKYYILDGENVVDTWRPCRGW